MQPVQAVAVGATATTESASRRPSRRIDLLRAFPRQPVHGIFQILAKRRNRSSQSHRKIAKPEHDLGSLDRRPSAALLGQQRCPISPRRCMIPAVRRENGRELRLFAQEGVTRASRLTDYLIGQLGYVGIALILVLGGLGLPIPEEAPIIVAAVLSRNDQLKMPLAFASCLGGVIAGDLVVYFLGFWHGEKVLSLPVTRRLLTRQREAQIKGYFHRHGFKILVSGRFVPGFRTAAYLTAGILKLPALKLLATDLVAATLTTTLMFGLGYVFAQQIQSGIREVQQWVTVIVAAGLASWLLYRYYRARQSAGLPVGPPVLDSDDVPLPGKDAPPSTAAPGPETAVPRPPAAPASPASATAGLDAAHSPGPGAAPAVSTRELDADRSGQAEALPAPRGRDHGVAIPVDAPAPAPTVPAPTRAT
jgi:membrane protein DedA with SNARE-associated domain